MNKARKSRNQLGQALVEYILVLAVTIALAATFGNSIRTAILGLWTYITRSVTAACPTGCPSNPAYRLR